VKISGGDANWKSLVHSAFKHRIAFDLADLNKLNLSDARIHKMIVDWSVRWTYSPRFTDDTSVRFVPDKLSHVTALWNIPPPEHRCGKRL